MTRWVLRLNDRLARGLGVVERLLVSVVALLLVGFAALGLLNTVALVKDTLVGGGDYTVVIAEGIDAAFLTIILLELLHTVLSRGSLGQEVQEFLVIGITSAVRHGLTVAANVNGGTGARARTSGLAGTARDVGSAGSARDVGVNLAINAAGVLILVGALWLVRQHTGRAADAREGIREDAPPATPEDRADEAA